MFLNRGSCTAGSFGRLSCCSCALVQVDTGREILELKLLILDKNTKVDISLTRKSEHSGYPKSAHLKTGIIRKPDFLKIVF